MDSINATKNVRKRSRLTPQKRLDYIFVFSILIVQIIQFGIFWVYTNIDSFLMAFQLPTGEWSLDTYRSVFMSFKDPESELWISLRNTGIYFSINIFCIPFQLFISYFMFRKLKGYRVFQVILYMPGIISSLVMTSVFSAFVSATGPFGEVMKFLGASEVPELLGNSKYATKTIVFYCLWLGWAGNMIVFGGTLARVPVEVLESARIDGINSFQEFFKMIIPLLWPTICTLLILALTGIFTASGPILLLTNGAYKTSTLDFWIFSKIKYTGESAYNEVAATGLLLTAIGMPIILGIRKILEKAEPITY